MAAQEREWVVRSCLSDPTERIPTVGSTNDHQLTILSCQGGGCPSLGTRPRSCCSPLRGGRRLRFVEVSDEVLQICRLQSVGGEGRGPLVCRGRWRRLGQPFLLLTILVVGWRAARTGRGGVGRGRQRGEE